MVANWITIVFPMNKLIQSKLDIRKNEHLPNSFASAIIWKQLRHFSWVIQIVIANAFVTIN